MGCLFWGIQWRYHGIQSYTRYYTHIKHYLVGGIPTPLKNISQLESLFLIYGKIENASNHQPVIIYIYTVYTTV